MSYAIATAVGPDYVKTFQRAGIRQTHELLERAAEIKARLKLAQATKLSPGKILEFVTVADMIRIKGLGPDYIRLLHLARVKTVRELRYRNPAKLMQEMVNANALHDVAELLPSIKTVTGWIEQAKQLPIKISYR